MADTQYATPAQLQAEVQGATAVDSSVLQRQLNAAAYCIDHWSGRKHIDAIDTFLAPATATVRLYPATRGYYVYTDECCAYTLVEQKDDPSDDTYETLAAENYIPFAGSPERPDYNSLPHMGLLISAVGDQEPFTTGRYSFRPGFKPEKEGFRNVPTLRITGKWGYSLTTPPVVTSATLLLASRWWKRGQSAWSDAIASSDFGMVLYRQQKDPDVMMMLYNARLILPGAGK